MVKVTELYNAAGQPSNRKPTNFKNSKEGVKIIQSYQQKGTYVWSSKISVGTTAIVPLASAYLQYLGDSGAVEALRQVCEKGQNFVEYDTPHEQPSFSGLSSVPSSESSSEYSSEYSSQSSSESGGCIGCIGLVVLFIIILGFFQQASQQYQTPEYQLPPSQPQFRPLSFK